MDVDHIFKPSQEKNQAGNAATSGTFKRVDLPGMNDIEGIEEAFNLDPVKLPKKEEQFSFGKGDQRKGQDRSISQNIIEEQ